MVDPNPLRGMPATLKAYWITGKGAAKIRWSTPGDFARCVRNLRKYFPTDPKGLCANLHHDAMGKWPGREHPNKMALEDRKATALLAAAPLGDIRWLAPLAPIGTPTGDGRRFQPGALSFRRFPLPLSWIKAETGGHQGRMTVGRILGATIGPGEDGKEYAWGFGDFFSPADIPEVAQALTLIRGGVSGISLDPGGLVRVGMSADNPEERIFLSYRSGGATLVSIPAFEGQFMLLGGPDDTFDDDDDTDEYLMMADAMEPDEPEVQDVGGLAADCGCDTGDDAFAVNAGGWRGLPLASRETKMDKDDAARRIAAWAGGDASKLNRAFLWRHPQGDPTSVYSYRLPVGDIIDGKLTLVFHAIYAASALLEGAHGGLPNIPNSEKEQLRKIISAIYRKMATDFNDPTVKASWDREVKRDNGVTKVEGKDNDKGDFTQEGETVPLTELAADILVSGMDENLTEDVTEDAEPIVATGAPVAPPAAWLQRQDIVPKAGLTITPEGQVSGYLALWKSCHMSVGRGRCMKAPRSRTEYQYFHLGNVRTAEGETIPVGRLTVGGGHADVSLGILPALEHYDNAGTTVAVVRAFEDNYGIQVAGAIVAGATPEQVAMLHRCPLSGDWRGVNGNLELVAALAVNVPGFPVFAEDESGHELALISAGFAGDDDHDHGGADAGMMAVQSVDAVELAHEGEQLEESALSTEEIAVRAVQILDERAAAKSRLAALREAREFDEKLKQERRKEILRNIVGAK